MGESEIHQNPNEPKWYLKTKQKKKNDTKYTSMFIFETCKKKKNYGTYTRILKLFHGKTKF